MLLRKGWIGPCVRRLQILRKALSIDFYDCEGIVIHDYEAQAHIKAAVAV
jgi:thymidylate synthase